MSPNHAYKLLYQTDGNLVLYRGDGLALWASNTAGQTPGQVIMQADGNLVIYGPSGVQFATDTYGNPNAVLILQNDGNLVIYAAGPIFATGTVHAGPSNPVPNVQWQVSTDQGANFTDIAGATGVALSFGVTPSQNDNRYRAVFSNGSGLVAFTAPATLTVRQPPAITSTDGATFSVGIASSFNVTAIGYPAPTLSVTGTLPDGLTYDDGLLSGTPAAGSGGVYPLTITASNGFGSDDIQSFTLEVNEAPAITSATAATFTVGSAAASVSPEVAILPRS